MLHQPHNVDAPDLLLFGLEADALEGDPDLDLVSVLGNVALGFEHVVGAEIGLLPLYHGSVEAVSADDPVSTSAPSD